MKASTNEVLAKDSLNPQPANVTIVNVDHGIFVFDDVVWALSSTKRLSLLMQNLNWAKL